MHKKITEYKIISSHAEQVGKIQHMDKLINEHLAEGWQPKGNLMVDAEGTLFQVVVKYEAV